MKPGIKTDVLLPHDMLLKQTAKSANEFLECPTKSRIWPLLQVRKPPWNQHCKRRMHLKLLLNIGYWSENVRNHHCQNNQNHHSHHSHPIQIQAAIPIAPRSRAAGHSKKTAEVCCDWKRMEKGLHRKKISLHTNLST